MTATSPASRGAAFVALLALGLLAGCPAPKPTVSRKYRCETDGGCTVTVSGHPEYYPYGVVVPVACGPGVIFVGCGCGPVVVGPACGPGVVVACGACGGSCGVAVAACGGAPSCGSSCGGASCGGASCGGGGCGGGCGGCS